MEWVVSKLAVPGANKRCRVAHFDVAGADKPVEDCVSLEPCEGELGAVLWREAVDVFVPFLVEQLQGRKTRRALCLGEGTGATGLALAASQLFNRVIITDLPALMPLLLYNVDLNPKLAQLSTPLALDWLDPKSLEQLQQGKFDTVIACEVLYGNRHSWPGLKRVLMHALKAGKGEAFFCLTLRNERHDMDDFTKMLYEDGCFRPGGEWELTGEIVVFSVRLVRRSA
jgi:Lysine methyltransferase